jgi:uncharacterized membrane protein YhaH (DUF805 family)
MLGFLFGFNARLGRLHFFLALIALAVVMTAICFAIASYFIQSNPREMLSSASLMGWPVIAAMVFFGWMSFTLHSMRIRDIGWDPVCVIPAWIAILIVDKLVAGKIPTWSLGRDHNGTIVGALTHLVLCLALMFWPSGGDEGATPTFGEPPRNPNQPQRQPQTASVATDRISRASGAQFGRRAF